MLLNCGVGEDSWKSSDCKEIQPVHPKGNLSWIFIERTDAEAETPILWLPDVKNWLTGKDPDAGKDWRQEEKGMPGWMASPTHSTWVWVNSGSWWWTGRPGVLQSMGLQRVGRKWATELNWTLFPTLCPQIHSLSLCLYSCLTNRFISTIFLDPIYMH